MEDIKIIQMTSVGIASSILFKTPIGFKNKELKRFYENVANIIDEYFPNANPQEIHNIQIIKIPLLPIKKQFQSFKTDNPNEHISISYYKKSKPVFSNMAILQDNAYKKFVSTEHYNIDIRFLRLQPPLDKILEGFKKIDGISESNNLRRFYHQDSIDNLTNQTTAYEGVNRIKEVNNN